MLGGQQRRRRIEHEHVAFEAGERLAGRGDGIAGAERLLLDRDLNSLVGVAESGEATTTTGSAPASRAASITQSTTRRPSSGCRCFGTDDRMRVPSPPAITTAARLFVGVTSVDGWGARIRTWDRGTKTRCLTTWLRPTGLIVPQVLFEVRPPPRSPKQQDHCDGCEEAGDDQHESCR